MIDLPPELLSSICMQVSSQQDLENLALSSKLLYDLATPLLYRHIRIDLSYNPRPDPDPITGERDLKLRRLLKLFVRKPKLASYVRTLSNHPAFSHGHKPRERGRDLPLEDEVHQGVQHVSRTREEYESWMQDVSKSEGRINYEYSETDADAIMALLISRLPALEALYLEADMRPDRVRHILTRISKRERPFDSPTAFPRLHSLMWNANAEFPPRIDLNFLLIPSMRNVYMFSVDLDTNLDHITPGSSNVEDIQLRGSNSTHAELIRLFGAPRALEALVFAGNIVPEDPLGFSIQKMHRMLSTHKATLRCIWLTHLDFDPYYFEDPGNLGNTLSDRMSFKGYTQLRGLRINSDFLFGFDLSSKTAQLPEAQRTTVLSRMLPPQLEVLELESVQDELAGHLLATLSHLLQQQRDARIFPQLRHIWLHIDIHHYEEHCDTLCRIAELARGASVKFALCKFNHAAQNTMLVADWSREWGWNNNVTWREIAFADQQHAPPVMLELTSVV